ncbi:hypothetical protein [Pseudomonas sp. HS6]|uniref:hypothetical protein n=1 Tax=Pseudomonas sp. HS6 TaxID=2850559 RepID=UPI002019F88C|nr:hypothetical protein [Pseudomonas sp. HS6]UQS13936.1 hypothetical protein JJN09_22310 [Pseudomonas sp. HS6]
MKGQPEHRPKALAVSLQPDVFHALSWHALRYEMSPRAFLAHLAVQYVAAMEQAEQASSLGR